MFKKNIKRNKVVAGIVLAFVLIGVFAYRVYAQIPRAEIVFYSTGSSAAGLTTSQLLEVKTSGFDKAAYLEYTYTHDMEVEYRDSFNWGGITDTMTDRMPGHICIFRDSQTSNQDQSAKQNWVNRNETKTFTSPFFAWEYGEWGRGTITVSVKDVNPESSTYDHVVTTQVNGLDLPKLSRDINAGIGTLVKGETKEIRDILASGGMPMYSDPYTSSDVDGMLRSGIDKFEAKLLPEGMGIEKEDVYLNSQLQPAGYKYHITATNSGLATIAIGHNRRFFADDFYSNTTNLFRDDYGTAYGDFDFYVFDHKPSISPGLRTVTLTNTLQGVTYSLGGESYTCTKDNEEIVFGENEDEGFLMIGKEYRLEMSKKVKGKQARMMMHVETRGTSFVTCDFNGVSPIGNPAEQLQLPYNTENLSTKVLSALGYDFLGWNSEPDGTGINYSQAIVDREYLTVYAQWEKRHYTIEVNLTLDNQPYQNAQVSLYQNGKQLHELVAQGGIYQVSNVEYSQYADNDGAYDIYINGKDSGNNLVVTGAEPDQATISQTLHCFNVWVNLMKEGSPWENQNVLLNKMGEEYEMAYDAAAQRYQTMFIYTTSSPKDGPYVIYVNNKLVQKESDPIKLEITNNLVSNGVDLAYYKAEVEVKKDGVEWNEPIVTLRQNEVVKAIMTYNATSKKYETEEIIDFGQSYDVYIEGTNSKENVNKQINATSKSTSLVYYSVSFKDASKVYNTQNLLSGDTARKPSNPAMDGNTFSYWSSKQDGSGTKYFQNGVATTEPITQKTEIYAIWIQPSVKVGDYIRCNSNGAANSKGSYYRLGNIAILGFPGASGKTPIRTAEITITKGSGSITVNTPGSYTITGNNTTKVMIRFANGVSMATAENFLKNNVVIAPNTAQKPHAVKVRIFGVTG